MIAPPRQAEVPRHYGTPREEYRGAVATWAVADRSHRARWKIVGRDPAGMLNGIVTNRIPEAPRPPELPAESGAGGEPTVLKGRGRYGAILTPKGRMVTDHRLFRLIAVEAEEGGSGGGSGRGGRGDAAPSDGFLLDLPATAVDGVREHFTRFLPPRFARVVDVSTGTGMLTVVGPEAARGLGRAPLGLPIEAEALVQALEGLEEDELLLFDREGSGEALRLVRSGDVAPPAFDVIADTLTVESVWRALREAGALPLGMGVWETLRVEAGTPSFGVDMDAGTIPVEAGIHDRAIDYEKGCYTGQEVIVRIRDRGRVNRHLRGLRMGSIPTPPAGTPLYREGSDRPVGEVTSAVDSPRYGEVAALGYVRREVEPPAELRLDDPGGELVRVFEIERRGYGPELS